MRDTVDLSSSTCISNRYDRDPESVGCLSIIFQRAAAAAAAAAVTSARESQSSGRRDNGARR